MNQFLRTKETLTAAAASALEADISGDDPIGLSLHVKVYALTGQAVIVFEDTVNNFSAAVPKAVFTFKGPLNVPMERTIHARDMELRIGVSSAELRERLAEISAAGSITYESWLSSGNGVVIA